MNSNEVPPRRPSLKSSGFFPSSAHRRGLFRVFAASYPGFSLLLSLALFSPLSASPQNQSQYEYERWFEFEPYPVTIVLVILTFVILLLWQFSRARMRRPGDRDQPPMQGSRG